VGVAGRLAGVALAAAAMAVVPAAAQSPPAQQVSVDALTDALGQHQTAVEPDSFSFGNTVVAAFQVGRSPTAGASAIGWSTSHDGGSSWSSGVLPSLTIHGSPPGSYTRATDPAVAYDSAHGTWMISVLALQDGPSGTTEDLLSALVTSRSPDGVSWTAPAVTSSTQSHFAHDKNWIVCDNGETSPFRGRCYVVWTAVSGSLTVLGISSSTDGGATWTPATLVTSLAGSGWQPLVRPDGTLVIIFAARALEATRSTDGGRSFSDPVVVSSIQDSPTPGWRAPALPSAEMDARGRITVAWPDCRFRSGCGRQTTSTDVVFSSSPDGVRWSRVRRVPTGPDLDGLPHFVVGLGVDTSTSGSRTRLGLTFHLLTPRGCSSACFVAPYFVSSSDNGDGWSAPEQLAPPQAATSFPQAGAERFLGDYISTSFATGGTAVALFASATRPYDGRYHQGIFATAIPPRLSLPLLRAGKVVLTPRRPPAHSRVDTSVVVAGLSRGLQLTCRSASGRLHLIARHVTASRVTCRWRLRDARAGERLTGTIDLRTPEADVSRRFAFRVGRG
jgi:hypothetical protein